MMKKRNLHHVAMIYITIQQIAESYIPATSYNNVQQFGHHGQHKNMVPTYPFSSYRSIHRRIQSSCKAKSKNDNKDDNNIDDDDDDDEIDVSNQDWRAFRAKLVMGDTGTSSKQSSSSNVDVSKVHNVTNSSTISESLYNTNDLDGIGTIFQDDTSITNTIPFQLSNIDTSQWAYESGKVIEKGAVILGGVEQDYGFGLRQQYFHKAAILVLDHDESTFTRGIILNRPSDLTLDDSINPGVKWRVWFGGDVQGLTSNDPEIICLHSIRDNVISKVSIPVINDIQWTTFDIAKKLVQAGCAKSTDFWVFSGYAGWGPKQLMGELERKSWYMVTTDSQTLLQELARLSANADPRDAGLDTWSMLMNMIGRSETANDHTGDFDDLMLKEWALKNLLSIEAGGGAVVHGHPIDAFISTKEVKSVNPLDRFLKRVSTTSMSETIGAGTVLRASSFGRSPFLLVGQELHKSIIVILSDDNDLTVGVILNRPGAKGLDVRIHEKITGKSRNPLKVPLRFGGQYAVKGQEALLWLHCDPTLKSAKVGSPIGNYDGIWKCTANDMISAVGKAIVTPENFVVVAGVSVWAKGNTKGLYNGIQGDIRTGKFEVVPESKVHLVWKELLKQEVLTEENINKNLIIADTAWNLGSSVLNEKTMNDNIIPMTGLGEGFDEDDDEFVYNTDVKVSKLSDDALRSWVATFLLGAPLLGE